MLYILFIDKMKQWKQSYPFYTQIEDVLSRTWNGPLSSSGIANAILQLEMEAIHMDEIFIAHVSLSI